MERSLPKSDNLSYTFEEKVSENCERGGFFGRGAVLFGIRE